MNNNLIFFSSYMGIASLYVVKAMEIAKGGMPLKQLISKIFTLILYKTYSLILKYFKTITLLLFFCVFCYSIPTGIHLPCIFLQKKSSSSGISTCLVWIITIFEIFCGLKQKPIPVFHFLFLLQLPFSLVLKTVDTEVVVVVRI